MPNSIFCSLLLLTITLNFGWSAPDRESFAKVDRPVEGVPVEAFELGDGNLTVQLGRGRPSFIRLWRWTSMRTEDSG